MEFLRIDFEAIERAAKRIEKANLKTHGRSLSWNSMLNNLSFLKEIESDSNFVKVEKDWCKQLKSKYLI